MKRFDVATLPALAYAQPARDGNVPDTPAGPADSTAFGTFHKF